MNTERTKMETKMETEGTALIAKRTVRRNKAMKQAQKEAKKRYGRVRMDAPRLRIGKVVRLQSEELIQFGNEADQENKFTSCEKTNRNKTGEVKEGISRKEILFQAVEQNNLRGMSGGGFPTIEKLRTFDQSKTEKKYLLINAVECEPGLLHDEWLLQHKINEIKTGINYLKSCFEFETMFLASKLSSSTIDLGSTEIRYIQVPNRYPMGQEMMLIQSVLGIKREQIQVPAAQGILVLNLQTVMKIGQIMEREYTEKQYNDMRYLTVADLETATAHIVAAPMGMALSEIAQKVLPGKQNLWTGAGSLYAHPLQTGECVAATTCFLGSGTAVTYEEDSKCKNCGGCTKNCPGGVDVRGIVRAIEKGQTSGFEQYHPERCMSCGACSYLCHAGKNTLALILDINQKSIHTVNVNK